MDNASYRRRCPCLVFPSGGIAAERLPAKCRGRRCLAGLRQATYEHGVTGSPGRPRARYDEPLTSARRGYHPSAITFLSTWRIVPMYLVDHNLRTTTFELAKGATHDPSTEAPPPSAVCRLGR